MKSLIVLLAGALLTTGIFSCNKRARNGDAAEGCPENIVCTMELRSISTHILDKSGRPVVLDDFRTVRNRDGKTMNQYVSSGSTETQRRQGSYLILGDGTGQTERNGLAFTFIGYRGGMEVVRERFIIGHDCCHIQLLEGPQEIILSE